MATQLQIRRGTTAQMNAFTGAEGELAVNTSTDTVHVHDGATAGGFALAKADGSNIGTYAGSFTTISASGAITGNVTGNLTGSVLTAAQTNITSLGTLSALTVSGALTVDTNTLVVDATNNRVGIGISSPSELLHINRASGTGAYILIQDDSGGNYIGTDGGVLQFFDGSAVERMRISADGWVNPNANTTSNPADSQGLHFGWNLSNGGGESLIVFNQGAGATGGLVFSDNSANGTPVERMRILPTGGITFNGDTAQANALDDYEEGAWTPTVAGCSLNVGRAYYTKIGNLVTANFNFTVTATDGTTNAFEIGGKPFAGSSANSESNGSIMVRYVTTIANTINLSLYTYSQTSTIEIYQTLSNYGNWAVLNRSQVSANSTAFIGSITYETDT